MTPPSRLEAFKAYAKECKDRRCFAAMERFADVLKTASKVPESKCSSYDPSRGRLGQMSDPS